MYLWQLAKLTVIIIITSSSTLFPSTVFCSNDTAPNANTPPAPPPSSKGNGANVGNTNNSSSISTTSADNGKGNVTNSTEDPVVPPTYEPSLTRLKNPLNIHFLKTEAEIREPFLKQLQINELFEFYPAWNYLGRTPPENWHEIPITYFLRPPEIKPNSTFSMNIHRRHLSAINLCSSAVTSVMASVGNSTKSDKNVGNSTDPNKGVVGNSTDPNKGVGNSTDPNKGVGNSTDPNNGAGNGTEPNKGVGNSTESSDKESECEKIMTNDCDSMFPSPRNLERAKTAVDDSLGDFEFLNFHKYYGFNLFFPEDGTDLMTLKPIAPRGVLGARPSLVHPQLTYGEELFLDRVIFKFGNEPESGSEHAIDGLKFGMEIQFFFTTQNLSYWETLAQYKLLPEGEKWQVFRNAIALSVFAKVGKEGAHEPPERGSHFATFMNEISRAATMFWEDNNPERYRAVQVSKRSFLMSGFFDAALRSTYFTYQGSMTHPPCLSGLTWVVFEGYFWISHKTWESFAMAHSEFSESRFAAENFRPLNKVWVKSPIRTHWEMRREQGLRPLNQMQMDMASITGYLRFPLLSFPAYFNHRTRRSAPFDWKAKHDNDEYKRIIK